MRHSGSFMYRKGGLAHYHQQGVNRQVINHIHYYTLHSTARQTSPTNLSYSLRFNNTSTLKGFIEGQIDLSNKEK